MLTWSSVLPAYYMLWAWDGVTVGNCLLAAHMRLQACGLSVPVWTKAAKFPGCAGVLAGKSWCSVRVRVHRLGERALPYSCSGGAVE